MEFKKSQLVKILGCSQSTEDKWIGPINAACAKFGINTKLRLAAFIAQVGHESNRLAAVTENLNYSADGLKKIWPSRFNDTNAQSYARKPELIANKVYSGRMGNGDETSGDGWKYRGRGLIQCTGKSNYDAFSQACGVDAVSNPDSLTEPTNAALSAAWFWASKGLNAFADKQDFLTITKRINGGTNGQADREMLYKKALIVLGDQEPPKDDEELKDTPVPPNPHANTAPVTEQKTPAAQNSSIVEPRAASGSSGKSQYPWNLVYESRSGHCTEIDDTPGYERLNMTHRTGSYWEISPTGVFTHKSVLDSYKLTKEDSYEYTGSNLTTQVKGQSFHQVGGDYAIKTGGNYFINAPRIQFNTGTLAVSGEILSPRITADIFESPFSNTLAKVAMVAWDLGGGSGGSGVGGRATMGTPVINSSLGFANTEATEVLRTNKLAYQKPDGTPVTTNGVQTAAALVAATAAAIGVAEVLKNSDVDEKVANAMLSAAEEIDGAPEDNPQTRTPVFLKHVAFDKPTLLSQSTSIDLPDPALYVNNLHTIVNSQGVGVLHMSNGQEWIPIGQEGAQGYVDEQIGGVQDSLDAEINERALALANEAQARALAILEEATLRHNQITQGLLNEALARGAAVTAEADARQTADTSMSNLITTLTASVESNAAAIQNEQQTRVDRDTAEATARQALAAEVANNSAVIANEVTTRANADSALSNSISQLSSKTDGQFAAVTSNITTLTNQDSALSTRIDGLVAKTDATNASVASEQQARADADSALGYRVDQVTVQVANANAAIVTEQTARATADSAMADQITALVAKTDNTNAILASEQQVRADANSAMGSRVDSISVAAAVAQATADSAIGKINDISNDNILSMVEKSAVILEYNVLVNEQTSLEAQGTSFSITTEKTAYTTAINALKTYMTGLTPLYSDLTQNTTIDGPTFRTKFTDVYTARQNLLNALDAKAKSIADNAMTAIGTITNDNVLSKGEKSQVILQYNNLKNEQTTLEAQGTTFSITTEKTAYTTAINALTTYLTGLTPTWNDVAQDTTIDGPTFRTKFSDAYSARATLMNAIDAKAKTLADNAQTAANTANTAIAAISNDNVLSKGEKGAVILEYNVLINEQTSIDSQATAFGLTTEKTAYDNSITALTTYLTGLTPSWSDTAQDTTIVGTTFRTKFSDAYVARQALLNAMDAKAKAIADSKAKVTYSATAPTSPATGDIWIDTSISAGKTGPTSKTWNGSAWIDTDYRTAQNTADIISEQTARANGDSANATAINQLAIRVNGNGGSYEAYQAWDFNNSANGFSVAGATLTNGATFVTLASSSNDPMFRSPAGLTINGTLYDKVRMRVKRIAGTGWEGNLYYITGGHGETGSYYKNVPATAIDLSDWFVIEWDMAALTAGGADWTSNTITQLRFDLGQTAADQFQIDWVAVGKRGVGIPQVNFASVTQQSQANADAIGNIRATWGVKTNVNGHVAGISLISSAEPGGNGVSSSFTVEADQFKLVRPGTTTVVQPFTVDSAGNATFAGKLSAASGSFAGDISAATGTFAGSLNVKSATSGARTEITNQVIKVYDANGVLRVKLGNLDA